MWTTENCTKDNNTPKKIKSKTLKNLSDDFGFKGSAVRTAILYQLDFLVASQIKNIHFKAVGSSAQHKTIHHIYLINHQDGVLFSKICLFDFSSSPKQHFHLTPASVPSLN